MTKIVNNYKSLIFFTASFPYGGGEPFIETEIWMLSKYYDKIIIISSNLHSSEIRKVPNNVEVIRNNFTISTLRRFFIIGMLFYKFVRNELFLLLKNDLPVRYLNIKYLLVSGFRAIKINAFISSLIKRHNIKISGLCLYSYWWLDESIGISYFKYFNSKVTAITRCHGYDLYCERSDGNYLPFKKFTLENLDRVFSISNDGMDYIDDQYLIDKKHKSKILLSRLGVNCGEYRLINKKESNIFTIVSCCQVYPNKRIHLLMEAILQMEINIKWIHLGSYIPNFSEEYYESIIRKVNHNNDSASSIDIDFKGKLTNSEVLDFYRYNHVDLYINVSCSEGVPVSIMEAMSFSIPVIATDVGGTSEIVNSQNGMLIPQDIDAIAIKEEIHKFYGLSLDDLNSKRNKAYLTYKKEYNGNTNYADFIRQIKNIKKFDEK